jgi:hypothetical protein
MEDKAYVPKGINLTKVVFVLPLMAHLQVVVLNNKSNKPIQKSLAFTFSEAVDHLAVLANRVQTLPSGNWVGAYHRVDCL